MPAPWWGRYVGVPFVDRGFELSGCHCWGLVCLVFKEQLGVELPRADEISAADVAAATGALRAGAASPAWRVVVDGGQAFDVALIAGVPLHVGILVDAEQVLHTWQATDAVVMRRSHPFIRHKIISLHRHARFAT